MAKQPTKHKDARKKSKALTKKRAIKHAVHHVIIKGNKMPRSREGIIPMTKEEKENYYLDQVTRGDFVMPWLGPGRPPQFETPSQLWAAFKDYVEWSNANPWYKAEWKDHALQKVPLGRPFTWDGFGIRMGISSSYFDVFKHDLKKDDLYTVEFLSVLDTIDKCIRSQKFEGAMVGVFNSNLAAYDLGYKKDITNIFGSGPGLVVKLNEQSEMDLLLDVKKQLEEIDNPTPTRLPESDKDKT